MSTENIPANTTMVAPTAAPTIPATPIPVSTTKPVAAMKRQKKQRPAASTVAPTLPPQN